MRVYLDNLLQNRVLARDWNLFEGAKHLLGLEVEALIGAGDGSTLVRAGD